MIKFSNFCGIFATLFVTTTIILLASCSQDDDYYESDMYTLAEMETRSGGDPGGGGGIPDPPIPYNGNPIQAGGDTIKFIVEGEDMEVFIDWTRGYTGISAPVSRISVVLHYWDMLPDSDYTFIGSTGTWEGYDNKMKIKVDYLKDTMVVKNLPDHTQETVYYSLWKKFYHEYYPTCIPDPTLQPL